MSYIIADVKSDGPIPAEFSMVCFGAVLLDDLKAVMESFELWLEQHAKGRAVFVSDNVAFDWQFINYYFHHFVTRSGGQVRMVQQQMGEADLFFLRL